MTWPSETTKPTVQPAIVDSVLWMGKMYHAVKIGDQIWMKENLDAGKYINSYNHMQSNNGVIEKYYLADDSAKYSYLGGFYSWDEAMQYDTTAGNRGICPPGWHIPTKEEFQTLVRYVNSNSEKLLAYGAGIGMVSGNNETGFSAMPGGVKMTGATSWSQIEQACNYWTSTNINPENAWGITIGVSANFISINWNYKYLANQIRCIKNSN